EGQRRISYGKCGVSDDASGRSLTFAERSTPPNSVPAHSHAPLTEDPLARPSPVSAEIEPLEHRIDRMFESDHRRMPHDVAGTKALNPVTRMRNDGALRRIDHEHDARARAEIGADFPGKILFRLASRQNLYGDLGRPRRRFRSGRTELVQRFARQIRDVGHERRK